MRKRIISQKTITDIEKHIENFNKGEVVSVEQLFEKDWDGLVASHLGGWIGLQVHDYCEQADAKLEYMGMRKRNDPPRRYVAVYLVK